MTNYYRVGGCVRDMLLGIPLASIHDIDFAVEIDDATILRGLMDAGHADTNIITTAFDIMDAAVTARCSKVFLRTPEYLTIRGLDPNIGPVDFVLCRKDGPTKDGRRPEYVLPGDIYDDLARRDFTVNAMAILDGYEAQVLETPLGQNPPGLIDPHGGVRDLNMKMLRFVGQPWDRLTEDALRAFRAVRFSITKGFTIDPAAILAIRYMRMEDFDAVSTDRITDELMKCFKHDTRRTLFALERFPVMLDLALARGIWFMPTTKSTN